MFWPNLLTEFFGRFLMGAWKSCAKLVCRWLLKKAKNSIFTYSPSICSRQQSGPGRDPRTVQEGPHLPVRGCPLRVCPDHRESGENWILNSEWLLERLEIAIFENIPIWIFITWNQSEDANDMSRSCVENNNQKLEFCCAQTIDNIWKCFLTLNVFKCFLKLPALIDAKSHW